MERRHIWQQAETSARTAASAVPVTTRATAATGGVSTVRSAIPAKSGQRARRERGNVALLPFYIIKLVPTLHYVQSLRLHPSQRSGPTVPDLDPEHARDGQLVNFRVI